MKEEYHYTISRSDRIWLIVFVFFLLSWELVKYALPKEKIIVNLKNTSETSDTSTVAQMAKSRSKYFPSNKSDQEKDTYINERYEQDGQITPFPIQEATFNNLRSAGLSAKVANTVLKYISAGGKVKNANDLMKIYGMDSTQLMTASPYLIFPASVDIPFADSSKNAYSPYRFTKTLDLNQATVIQLDSLPGIGPVLAERIIKFKEGLGGFFDVNQLKDIYGLPPETFEKIVPFLLITTTPDLININNLDLTNFDHPYLQKRFPKMIKAYRDQHGPFANAAALRKVYPPDSNWCEKILPYLTFE